MASPRRPPTAPAVSDTLRPRLAADVVAELLNWYEQNRRSLPWRDDGDPYRVWVSEVMLQQTRVDVVRDYFQRFMARFPNLRSLAEAQEEEVLGLWKGLGYYSRARRLHQGARYCVEEHGGHLPPTVEGLLRVPGIGPYSAGAIASIAFGARSPLVDGNVIRVLSRLFSLRGDPGRAPLKNELWRVAERLVPEQRPGDFNQALMELGALVCLPRRPLCHACPFRGRCRAMKDGLVDQLPELPKKAPPEQLLMVALVATSRGRIAVQTLPTDARWWAGLDALPFARVETEPSAQDAADPPASAEPERAEAAARRLARQWCGDNSARLEPLAPLRHTVTRFRIQLIPFRLRLSRSPRLELPRRWVALTEREGLSLPAPHQKLLESHVF